MRPAKLSIVMPTLNAARHLPRSLPPLARAAGEGLVRELIVSDGGSTDDTLAMAEAVGAEIVRGEACRGAQLARGAAVARGDWILFLHADTALEEGWEREAAAFMSGPAARAGAFRFAFDDGDAAARIVAFWVGVRCWAWALPYGDQGLLISRALYDAVGGFRPYPLMEDVDLVRRIGRGRLRMLRSKAVTSAEKYRRDGFARRAFRNLRLLARFYAGASPETLAKAYD